MNPPRMFSNFRKPSRILLLVHDREYVAKHGFSAGADVILPPYCSQLVGKLEILFRYLRFAGAVLGGGNGGESKLVELATLGEMPAQPIQRFGVIHGKAHRIAGFLKRRSIPLCSQLSPTRRNQ